MAGGWATALGGIAQGIPQGIQDFRQIDQAYLSGQDQAANRLLGNALTMVQQMSQQQQPPPQMPQMPQQPPMGGMPSPGQPPMGGGPPPMPQGSPPMRPPQMGGQVGAPSPQPSQGGPMGQPGNPPPPPQMQPQGGGQQQGQGPQLDWRTIMQAIMQANPGAPPGLIAKAVEKAIPIMNSQSQIEWRNYIMPQLAQQRMQVQERGQDIAAGVKERGQDIQSQTQQRGQDVRAETAKAGQQQKTEQFNIKEARITAHQMVTADQAWQRLDQQRKALEARVKEGKDKQAITQWRAILDAQHKRTTEIISAYSQNSTMPKETREQLLKDSDEAYNNAIRGIGKGDKDSFSDRFQGGGQSTP